MNLVADEVFLNKKIPGEIKKSVRDIARVVRGKHYEGLNLGDESKMYSFFRKQLDDIKKAQEALETNVKLHNGQLLKGNEKKMKSLCQKHPDLFAWEGDDWTANMRKTPSKNKMMKKSNTKSKNN